MVALVDPAASVGADLQETLRSPYALPPAQARLAELLACGLTLKEAAATQGITEGSARVYLKRIFERVGTSRQPELVRKLTLLQGFATRRV